LPFVFSPSAPLNVAAMASADRTEDFSTAPNQFCDDLPLLDRLGRVVAMLEGVLVALGGCQWASKFPRLWALNFPWSSGFCVFGDQPL